MLYNTIFNVFLNRFLFTHNSKKLISRVNAATPILFYTYDLNSFFNILNKKYLSPEKNIVQYHRLDCIRVPPPVENGRSE